MSNIFQVWTCKIVVPGDAVLPVGFDLPPRLAAIQAVQEEAEVIACFSGWDGELTEEELAEVTGLRLMRSLGSGSFEPLY